jgi:cytochrome c5
MRVLVIIAVIGIIATGIAYAASQGGAHSISLPETRVELAPGEGKVKVETFCNICHSLDYITMQPKFSRAQWTATTTKMIKVMGAPISEDDAKVIVDYLVASYGTGN